MNAKNQVLQKLISFFGWISSGIQHLTKLIIDTAQPFFNQT